MEGHCFRYSPEIVFGLMLTNITTKQNRRTFGVGMKGDPNVRPTPSMFLS